MYLARASAMPEQALRDFPAFDFSDIGEGEATQENGGHFLFEAKGQTQRLNNSSLRQVLPVWKR